MATTPPPLVVLDKWDRHGIIHLVFAESTAMLDPDQIVERL